MLHKRNGTLHSSAEKVKFNDENRIFGEEDGFQLAIALVDFGNEDWSDA